MVELPGNSQTPKDQVLDIFYQNPIIHDSRVRPGLGLGHLVAPERLVSFAGDLCDVEVAIGCCFTHFNIPAVVSSLFSLSSCQYWGSCVVRKQPLTAGLTRHTVTWPSSPLHLHGSPRKRRCFSL